MTVDFSSLPDDARIWLYVSAQPLTAEQQHHIKRSAEQFTENWSAHQIPLKASFTILHHQFLVFGVDIAHHDISGCGIDKSVKLVQTWEQELGLPLFNRLQIELFVDNQVICTTKNEIQRWLTDGKITTETQVFNKLIQTLDELKNQFMLPLKNTWFYPQLSKQIGQKVD